MPAARAYLDHASTSRLRDAAFAAMRPYLESSFGDAGRLHAEGRVTRVALDVEEDVFHRLLETFEHLPRPIAVVEHLHRALKPGGCLVFDYVRSDGTGLDTAAALRDRVPALELILKRFDIVQGRVTTEGVHVDATVARKR